MSRRSWGVISVFFGLTAFGAPEGKEFRLKFTNTSKLMGGVSFTTDVKNNGTVVTERCQAVYPRPCRIVKTEQLAARQMDLIERLIEDASEGKIKKGGPVHCMAVPTKFLKYEADNGTVFLRSGATPCGVPIFNVSPAAENLVKLLNTLQSRAENSQIKSGDISEVEIPQA